MTKREKMKRGRPSPKAVLRGHTSPITNIGFLPDQAEPDRYLLTGDEKGTIRLWDVTFEETLVIYPIPSNYSPTPVQSICVHPDAPASVLVQYKSGLVSHLDLKYNSLATDLDAWTIEGRSLSPQNLPSSITSVRQPGALLNDSFCRAVFLTSTVWAGPGAEDTALVICDNRQDYACVSKLSPKKETRVGMLMTLARAGTDLLLAGYEDGSAAVWDVRKPDSPLNSTTVAKGTILASAVNPFGRVAVVGGSFDQVAGIADIENELHVIETALLTKPGIAGISWRHDGKLLATSGWDGMIRIWDGRRRYGSLLRKKGTFAWHDGTVQSVAYSGNGTLLASGGKDRTIALWDGI